MNAELYLNVTARLAYYDTMRVTAPARIETVPPKARVRKLLHLLSKQRPVTLVPAGNRHA